MKRKPQMMKKKLTDPYIVGEKVSKKHGTKKKVQKGFNTRNNM
jgi:hypothetical protein